ncbi:MAG: hypothetical protein QNK05_11325 [Myxococcota bacterium]|nr:hypothetical protein [Myxococcota bacterium]
MSDSSSPSKLQAAVGFGLIILGIAVFAVRLAHDGAYAMPRGGNLFGGVGALGLGVLLLWSATPGALRWVALAASPVVLFFGLYATMAELEEVISLYATDSAGNAAELRLWIVDREDGEWVGMPRTKAIEHSLDGARLDMLRNGQTRCVVPVLHEDRKTVRAIHSMKVEKYAVARGSAAIGLYPREARDEAVALRFDPCPPG